MPAQPYQPKPPNHLLASAAHLQQKETSNKSNEMQQRYRCNGDEQQHMHAGPIHGIDAT
jgi:hypothetical protein